MGLAKQGRVGAGATGWGAGPAEACLLGVGGLQFVAQRLEYESRGAASKSVLGRCMGGPV
jgi:hypothetical protein